MVPWQIFRIATKFLAFCWADDSRVFGWTFMGFLWLVSTQTQWFFSLISRWIRFMCLGQNVDFTMRLLFLLFGLVSSVHFLCLFPICH